jgi:hypothetical protein
MESAEVRLTTSIKPAHALPLDRRSKVERDKAAIGSLRSLLFAIWGQNHWLSRRLSNLKKSYRGLFEPEGYFCHKKSSRQFSQGAVSIHPREGDDNGRASFPTWKTCFDPRPREGGDSARRLKLSRSRRFDPRPREGGDATTSSCPGAAQMFRSTPPRRGRPLPSPSPYSRPTCFDPRPREGGDPPSLNHANEVGKFRSTPPRTGRPGTG